MNNRLPTLALTLLLALGLAGCDAILGIMEFGFWVGVIVVVLIIAIIAWIVRSVRGPRDGTRGGGTTGGGTTGGGTTPPPA